MPSRLLPLPVDSIGDMSVEHASLVDRGRPSVPGTSPGVVIAAKLGSFAAIPMEREKSPNGKYLYLVAQIMAIDSYRP